MSSLRRLLWAIYAFIIIVAIGVIGYMIIEGWSFLDSVYMTVTTITTVGFSEVHPLSEAGRIFSIFLIIGGVGGALYILTTIMGYLLEGQFGITMGRRRMKNKIARLKKHFILCGYGRVGEEIALTFSEEGVPFVVISNNEEHVARAEKEGYLALFGDATSDDVLVEAGIERAYGLVSAVGSDTDNTFITLSAREARPDLFIEARCSNSESEGKLRRAGADRVISPHAIGGRRMAMLALRPAVVEFIDTVTSGRGRELHLETVDIISDSTLIGLTMAQAKDKVGITVLAMRKQDGTLIPNPPDENTIEEGDRLIIIGTKRHLAALEKILTGKKRGKK
ncbi:MAG TPA: NAD-binding protein [Dehalococcoidales bacterium]|nr:NAD-binding protein [Dehalococcoidales bacterium]